MTGQRRTSLSLLTQILGHTTLYKKVIALPVLYRKSYNFELIKIFANFNNLSIHGEAFSGSVFLMVIKWGAKLILQTLVLLVLKHLQPLKQ
jgi:hypothetical protein